MPAILEKLNRLSGREQVILILTGIAAAILLIDRLLLVPVQSHLEATQEKIELRKREIVKDEKILALKPKVLPLYKEIVDRVKMNGSEDQQAAEMLHDIEKLGSESEVLFSNIKPRAAKTVDLYRILVADLEAECSIKKLFGFIYKLQTSGQIFRVENFKIRTHEKDTDLVRVSMTVTRPVMGEAVSAGKEKDEKEEKGSKDGKDKLERQKK